MTEKDEALLLADGEALLSRRAEIERAILRGHKGTAAALAVQIAQLGRQRDRVRVDLLKITAAADEGVGVRAGDDDPDPGYGEESGAEDFYAARERLAARDRELMYQIEALSHRARTMPRTPVPAPLADLESARAQNEAQVRAWRARCRRAGVELDLPHHGEFAGLGLED